MDEMSRTLWVRLYRWRVFRAMGHFLYRRVAGLTALLCRRIPEVRALYLTGSMASGDIVPGLSDIDIVIVIEDLDAGRELALVRHIEKRLWRVLPPFGQNKSGTHLMIYSSAEWRLVGGLLLGKKAGAPAVAFEKRPVPEPGFVGGRTRTMHHLFKAFWRLQDLQKNLSNPAESRLDALLRLRMCDRLLGALENAWREAGLSPVEFAETNASLRSELNRLSACGDDAGLAGLLPSLLDVVDRSIADCLHEDRAVGDAGGWREDPDARNCGNFSASVALADELQNVLDGRIEDEAIYVARLGATDLVVCESAKGETVRMLSGGSAARQKRNVNLVTLRMFNTFFLSEAFGPFAFVRLGDRGHFMARGELNRDRFALEAYSMFPRVRALSRLEAPGTVDAYVRSFQRLIDFAAGQEDHPGSPGHGDSDSVSCPAHARLRALSDRLCAVMTQGTEPEKT